MSSKNDDNAKETVDVYAISGPGYRETERSMKDHFSNISKAYLILECTLIFWGDTQDSIYLFFHQNMYLILKIVSCDA